MNYTGQVSKYQLINGENKMKKLKTTGVQLRGAKGDYIISKGTIDKYELFINKNYYRKLDNGDLTISFVFVQAFQFQKDAYKKIDEIEWEYIHSEEHIHGLISSGLMTKEEGAEKIASYNRENS